MIDFSMKYCVGSRRGRMYFAVFLAFLAGGFSATQAALVTFRFEAEITEITPSANANFSLPAEIGVGAVFDSMVTFEPPAFFGLDSSNASLSGSLESISFFAEQLPFITENDTGGTTGNTTFVYDTILLQCDSANLCGNYATNSPSLTVLDFALGLVGQFDAINPLFESGLDANAWNRLTDIRKLFLELSSPAGMGTYEVIAIVGPVRSVPEPASLCLAAWTVLLVSRWGNSRS